jgi:hypothetical protein
MARKRESEFGRENTPEAVLAEVLRELKAEAVGVNETAALIKPQWKRNAAALEDPQVADALCADMGSYLLHVVTATDEAVQEEPKGTAKFSWWIDDFSEDDFLGGGPADSVEQGKRFALLAYHATQGITLSS